MNRPQHGGNLNWAAAQIGCSVSSILDFSASINPLGPPAAAIAAIQSHLSDLTAYPDPNYQELRSALGQLHSLPPAWILPGNGSAELLTWAAWDLSQLPVTYLVTPAFGDYRRSLQAFNAQVLDCSLEVENWQEEHGIWPKAILPVPLPPAPSSSGLLLNNPHNPTGQLFARETILPLLEHFALVVVDEAFMDFLPPAQQESLIPMVSEFPNLVILRSLTKFYSLPGLRLGYAIAHPDRLHLWQQRRDPWPVNILAAAAGVAAVSDLNFSEQTWNWLLSTRTQLFQGLAQIPDLKPLPGNANFLLVHSQRSSSQLQQQLLEQHQILIRDCLSFPELGDRYFRIAVRTQADNQKLLTALANL